MSKVATTKRGDTDAEFESLFANMSAPMPFDRKLYLAFRNNFIKIWKRQNYCGHPSDPG